MTCRKDANDNLTIPRLNNMRGYGPVKLEEADR